MSGIKNATKGPIDLDIEEYHQMEGISRSGIMEFMVSPFHYYKKYIERSTPNESTKSLALGEILHLLILEPHRINELALMPKYDGRTKEGRLKKDTFYLENEGKIIVPQDIGIEAVKMAQSLTLQQFQLLRNLDIEKSFFWRDPHTDIMLKCRPDAYCQQYVIDVKTTQSAAVNSFKKSIHNYGYHIQAAMIEDGLREVLGIEIQQYIFIIIENQAPYATATYILDKNAIAKGREVYKNCLLKLKECIISNNWPSYETQIIDLPTWAY